MRGRSAPWLFTLFLLLIASVVALPLFAQSSTTATIRGKVVNQSGNIIPNAEINAVSTSSGFVTTVHSRADGTYTLAGLTPGEYNVVVAAQGYEPKSETLTVRVGQVLDTNLALSPTALITESITVVGNQLIDTRSSEDSTNVTPQQIQNLPQNERNFLNFAAMAPGIRLSNDPTRKTIASDAQPAEQTNVFIDGISTKNDVLQGGTSGQDSSRGNPFPQNAVQEFRVITQNFGAQYDHASSAIITAVTKSGTNQLSGDAFVFYQPRGWVAPLPSNFQFGTPITSNADYRRYQSGLSVGGPIIKDRLHYFLSYEGDNERATTPVTIGNANYVSQFGQYVGRFPSPFKSTLLFGKGSWQPSSGQLIDLSGNYRREHETRDFGGQTSYQSATDLRNWVYGATLRHQFTTSNSSNEFLATLQKYGWNPQPLNPNLVGLNYQGVIRLGGNSTTQDFDQRRFELRDNYNFAPLTWQGLHNFQVGGNLDFMHYKVNKSLNGNPEYEFTVDPATNRDFTQPFEAVFGFGNPILTTSNNEYGIYGQDNWAVNQHLSLNLGLRWDYETHMLDENYVTPANIVAGLSGKFTGPGGVPSTAYFSNGNSRKPFKGEWQPRLGFSYDIAGDSRSVVFGGFGRYYDRLFLNATLDERYRLQFPVYRLEFSQDGLPRFGGPTIKWDPSYLTPAGLNALAAQGSIHPEIYLLFNDTKPPYSNQWNLGFRQTLGSWLGAISYNGVRGYRGMTWLSASGLCCTAIVPGYGNVIISDPNGKRYWYDGIYLSLDRPLTNQSNWGAHVAWTHGKATQTGNDLFSLDYPSAAQYPRHIVPGTERDRIVATGIWRLPADVKFSAILSFGSGAATPLLDFSQGFSLENRIATNAWGATIYPKKTWGFGDRSIDLRLEKDFVMTHGTHVDLIGEGFNIANFHNYGCLNNFIPPEGNPSIGQAGCVINLGRRFQAGLRVGF